MSKQIFTTRPELLGTFGAVTSTHWMGTATGMAILEQGGNAFDAAVATGFVLQVVEPHLNGPGGDMPAIFHAEGNDLPQVICGQGSSPAAASLEKFAELGLDLIPGSGLLCAVVPGAFDGWMTLLRDYGTMTLPQVLQPAINYARHGYPVAPRMAVTIEAVKELFANEWHTSAEIYLPHGNAPKTGTLFSNYELASTYTKLVNEAEAGGGSREIRINRARKIWYEGWIAENIDAFFRTADIMDVSGRRHRGLLTGQDLASWQSTYESPVTYDYNNFTVCKCGAWSQGPVLLQQLAILDGMNIDQMHPTEPEFVHTMIESFKLAFADREAYYGDPDFIEVPMKELLSRDYNSNRRNQVEQTASGDFRPGFIKGKYGSISKAMEDRSKIISASDVSMGIGEPTVAKSGVVAGDTVHIDVIDKYGNMISCTPSGGWLQSSPIIPTLGFCLGNRGQMFWLDPNSPSSLAPKKRPRTTLSPSLALRNGEPYMVFGTPGGDQQDQWSTLLFLHHTNHGMNLQEAIDCPAFHTEHLPSSFWPRGFESKKAVLEGRFSKSTIDNLQDRGHKIEVGDDWSEGRLSAACLDGELIKAAANPRGMHGYAICR